jgi:hypothetical protein
VFVGHPIRIDFPRNALGAEIKDGEGKSLGREFLRVAQHPTGRLVLRTARKYQGSFSDIFDEPLQSLFMLSLNQRGSAAKIPVFFVNQSFACGEKASHQQTKQADKSRTTRHWCCFKGYLA